MTENSTYYGTVSINDKISTVVKVIDGGVLSRKMIVISLWKKQYESGDFGNAILHIEHTTMSFYKKEALKQHCDEKMFNKIYKIALDQF